MTPALSEFQNFIQPAAESMLKIVNYQVNDV